MEDNSHHNEIDLQRNTMRLPNPHLAAMETDHLYHIGMTTHTHDFPKLFGDVKFVCIGGQPSRMSKFAAMFCSAIGEPLREGQTPYNFANATDRYAVYKAGPVLAVSHGIGFASLSILLHEIFKLLRHAKCQDVKIIRIGTSGGLGIEAGTVVITEQSVNGMLNNYYEIPVLGKVVRRYAVTDTALMKDILDFSRTLSSKFPTVTGKTLSVADFYEGQARLDGAICEYSEEEKMEFLNSLVKFGVVNIEMESLLVSAMCHKAGIPCATVCVTLLDRLEDDQVRMPKEMLQNCQERPLILVIEYIKHKLGIGERPKSENQNCE